jgi:phage terminase large subunit GpA-like protein
VAFPSGLDDEYFQELVSERRTAVKRNGFTVYRWTKDDRQDNESLDTMVQATGAALRYGVYGLADTGWARLESERGRPSPPPVRNEVRIITAEPPSPAWARIAELNKLTQNPSSEFRAPDRR